MRLLLDDAYQAINAALAEAEAMKIAVCVAVCDAGGRLIAFSRMDDSNWASIYGCQGKALTAAATRCPSGSIPSTSEVMQRIAVLEGANMIFAQGAVPIICRGELLGAIGVGGATGPDDELCAMAGAAVIVRKYAT
jgi:uncharacterized protein GlcG (DUF336 family)